MPDQQHTSESIHKVVNLISGMGLDPHSGSCLCYIITLSFILNCIPLLFFFVTFVDKGVASPQERLKEALSTPEAFLKVYLEFSELVISTYKHIGHFRYARLIGRELAFLYMYVLITIAEHIIELTNCIFFHILTLTGR